MKKQWINPLLLVGDDEPGDGSETGAGSDQGGIPHNNFSYPEFLDHYNLDNDENSYADYLEYCETVGYDPILEDY